LRVVAGALHCYDKAATLQWKCHQPGRNFTAITAAQDPHGDGKIQVLISMRMAHGRMGRMGPGLEL